ncbi:MAG: nucleotidyltransferase domain-containing protein, partial [Bacteroidales bacterium]|nr:nucleotidyltransferase domain-containing protein [Bacteroidales bacterium]
MDLNLIEKLKNYLKSAPVNKAWIFGSFSRNEESSESDIDILVELNRDVKLGFGFFRMARDLEQISG